MSDALDILLKEAMQRFAQNVSVITVVDKGIAHAMVASSVTSVTMEPPSMLVCVNKQVSMFEAMQAASDFTINLLAEDHAEIANLCAGGASGEDRFALGNWQTAEERFAVLGDAVASIWCKSVRQVEHGSHVIFIGEVEAVSLGEAVAPLLYHERGYRRLAAH